MTRAAALAAVATTALRVPPAQLPTRPLHPGIGTAAIACGHCGEVVELRHLRWRNRRSLLLGCRWCTPKEDPCT